MNFALLFFIIYHLVTVDVSAVPRLVDTVSPMSVSPMELLSTLNITTSGAQPSRAEIKFRYNEDGDCDSNHVMTLCGYGTTWNNETSSVKKCEIIPELLTELVATKLDIGNIGNGLQG